MNRIAVGIIALVLFIPLAGCAILVAPLCVVPGLCTALARSTPDPTFNEIGPVAPAPDKALVVFLLDGNDIQSSVFEVKDNQSLLVGGRIVAPRTHTHTIMTGYQAEPGKRLFMVIGENADFMTADLLPDRTYYVRVVQRFGFMQQRYGLKPVDRKQLDSLEFKKLLSAYRWAGMTDAADQWARSNMAGIESKRTEYYPDWVRKPESERPHLAQGDGR